MLKILIQKNQLRNFWTLFILEVLSKFLVKTLQISLAIYIVKIVSGSTKLAYEWTASFGIISYATPMIFGDITDRYFGLQRSMKYGLILMTLGSIFILFPIKLNLLLSIVLIGVGTGFFKPNILATLGSIFSKKDQNRGIFFGKFYLSSSVGEIAAIILTGVFIEFLNYPHPFFLCIISCFFSFLLFMKQERFLFETNIKFSHFRAFLIIGGLILSLMLVVYFSLNILIIISAILYAIFTIKKYLEENFKNQSSKKIINILIIVGYASIFFSFIVQSYFALCLIIENFVDRKIVNNWVMPSAWFMLINPFLNILLGTKISNIFGKFNIFKRMEFSFLMISLGYFCLFLGFVLAESQVNCMWIIVTYLLFVVGELAIIPYLISELTCNFGSRFRSRGVGFWYSTMAMAQYLASLIAECIYREHMGLNDIAMHFLCTVGGILFLIVAVFYLEKRKGYSSNIF